MKQMLQQTSKKYIFIPIAMLGMVAVLAFSVTDKVNAFGAENQMGGDHKSEFAAVIAQKFGLNQSEVEETIEQYHAEEREAREQEMESRMSQRLEKAVAEGRLTESQMSAILEKQDEMHERLQEIRDQDLSAEDKRELRADIHEEMEEWAAEQGIDFDVFLRFGRRFVGPHF